MMRKNHICNSYCMSDMTKKPNVTKQQQNNQEKQDDKKAKRNSKNKEDVGWGLVKRQQMEN